MKGKTIGIVVVVAVVAAAGVGGYMLMSGDGGGGAGGISTPSGFSSYGSGDSSYMDAVEENMPEEVDVSGYMTDKNILSSDATSTFVSSLEDEGWKEVGESDSVYLGYNATLLEKGDQAAAVWSQDMTTEVVTVVITGPKDAVE